MRLSDITIRDPYILADEHTGIYYMYASSPSPLEKGFCVYISYDLQNWQAPRSVFVADKQFWAQDEFWAPEVHYYCGKYYMFATFGSKSAGRTSQILVASNPLGPFVVHSGSLAPDGWYALDATLYVKDGEPYTIFSHEWVQVFDGEMCYAKLNKDLSQTLSAPIKMFKASDSGWANVPGWSKEQKDVYITDAPYVYNIDGTEFMLWSSWSETKEDAYSVGVIYPYGGDLLGGQYKHSLLNLPHRDAGHAMIFKDFNGKHRICYHKNNSQSGCERAVIAYIKIDEGELCVYEN